MSIGCYRCLVCQLPIVDPLSFKAACLPLPLFVPPVRMLTLLECEVCCFNPALHYPRAVLMCHMQSMGPAFQRFFVFLIATRLEGASKA